MSFEMWGPALDAEIAYRHEIAAQGLRDARSTGRAAGRSRRASVGRPADGARRPAAGRRRGRRWWLPGSGAWHAAR